MALTDDDMNCTNPQQVEEFRVRHKDCKLMWEYVRRPYGYLTCTIHRDYVITYVADGMCCGNPVLCAGKGYCPDKPFACNH